MEIFEQTFMIRAFIVGFCLALIVPCVGTIVVLRRLSMLGDTLSHSSLAGVAAGLLLGFNPSVGAAIYCVLAAMMIELLRKRYPQYAEISLAIVMSTGIGLAGLLSGWVNQSFNNFLFGSAVLITNFDLWLVVGLTFLIMLQFVIFYRDLFFIAFDEKGARLAGVPVRAVTFMLTIMTALTVAIAAQTVGALMVSSLMVLPTACSMRFARSFKQTVIGAVVLAEAFVFSGLVTSYYVEGAKPGATIVLIAVTVLVILMAIPRRQVRR